VLRYQPHSTSLIDLLPAQLRTPIPASTPDPIHETKITKNITVRKVTRSSPDSDDSFVDDSPEGLYLGRDDQFLVADRNENNFYGSVHAHGAPQAGGVPFDQVPGLGIIGRKVHEYAYLCPGFFPWTNPGPATEESGELFIYTLALA
jgi:cationic amino acid transporter 14